MRRLDKRYCLEPFPFFSTLFLCLLFLFLAPNFFHLPSPEPVTLLYTFTLSCPHFSFIATLLREGGGMFGEMIRKRAKFGFFYGQVHFSLPLPAERPNGLVQCADFCRKLLETLCVRMCCSGCCNLFSCTSTSLVAALGFLSGSGRAIPHRPHRPFLMRACVK